MVKKVGSACYVHKSNVLELYNNYIPINEKQDFNKLISYVEINGPLYDIIKYDKGNVTLVTSPDWDYANEPIVGYCYRWKKGHYFDNVGNIYPCKVLKNFKQIYHSKWMFVSDTYTGFNVEDAKKRTLLWNSLPDIKQVKKYIGYKKYWVNYLQKYGIEV